MAENDKLEAGKDLLTLAPASRQVAESSIANKDWSGLPLPVIGLSLVLEPRYKHKAMENFRWKESYDENHVRHEIPTSRRLRRPGFGESILGGAKR